MRSQWKEDDLFYVCTMIEYVARKTHNRNRDVVEHLSDRNLTHQLKVACVNHCLSFEQVCDEWMEEYGITEGIYDNLRAYGNPMPTETAIGRIYQKMILDAMPSREQVIETIRTVYESADSKEIAEKASEKCGNFF